MAAGIEVHAPGDSDVLSPRALGFVERLHRELKADRRALLERRRERARELAEGARLDFVGADGAESDWRVVPAPADLRDRRCEITGPPDRKMMINALNSGARVFMCDFEDACSPAWRHVGEGQATPR